jgi:hypothetical protein
MYDAHSAWSTDQESRSRFGDWQEAFWKGDKNGIVTAHQDAAEQ